MKKLMAASALSLATLYANAGTCVALDYNEMQDMSVLELKGEYCKTRASWNDLFSDGLTYLGSPRATAINSLREECGNQSNRIWRVLVKKGIEDTLRTDNNICKAK